MKPVPCPVPVTHALEAWAMQRAARALQASRDYKLRPAAWQLRALSAKYQALAEKEQANVRGAAGTAP